LPGWSEPKAGQSRRLSFLEDTVARYSDIFKLYVLDDDDTDFSIVDDGSAGFTTGALSVVGNDGENELTGNDSSNTLDGGAGNDDLIGGLGNDTYYVAQAGDTVTEDSIAGSGIDTIIASVSIAALAANVENLALAGTAELDGIGNALANTMTGNTAANTLEGRDGNDILNGGGGADELIGGLGNDTYVVDSADDVVTEDSIAGSGADTVQSSATFILSANVENLILTGSTAVNGTGNALGNAITGNAAANVLVGAEGNDVLDGGIGVDRLDGGVGNDSYLVDNTGDVVIEGANGGTDTVTTAANWTLAANVENLMAATGLAALSLTGNTGNNALTGNAGANRLDGGAGNDTMLGGAGNDTYIVDNALDVVTEAAAGGSDTVVTSVSYSLAAASEVEFLSVANPGARTTMSLTGSESANTISGDAGANTLNGMGGNDILYGELGKDILRGGGGSDTFVFDAALKAANVSRIVDFARADTIQLENGIFKGLKAGTLDRKAFHSGKAAHDSDDRIIYNDSNGRLYFDRDGTGDKYGQVHFATISNKFDPKFNDFFVI
jgi:Ca2+-binding RTX toxin-like protein